MRDGRRGLPGYTSPPTWTLGGARSGACGATWSTLLGIVAETTRRGAPRPRPRCGPRGCVDACRVAPLFFAGVALPTTEAAAGPRGRAAALVADTAPCAAQGACGRCAHFWSSTPALPRRGRRGSLRHLRLHCRYRFPSYSTAMRRSSTGEQRAAIVLRRARKLCL